jgi:hypothetical protein
LWNGLSGQLTIEAQGAAMCREVEADEERDPERAAEERSATQLESLIDSLRFPPRPQHAEQQADGDEDAHDLRSAD